MGIIRSKRKIQRAKNVLSNVGLGENKKAKLGSNDNNIFFELGFLKIKNSGSKSYHSLMCEEFTLTVQNENVPRYVCDLVAPVDLAPTKKKFTFSIKKPKFFESDMLYINTIYGGDFELKLYRLLREDDLTQGKKDFSVSVNQKIRNDKGNPIVSVANGLAATGDMGGDAFKAGDFLVEHVLTLNHCMVDSHSFGNFDGTKPVSEDIQGQSRYVTFSPNIAGYYKKTLKGDEL